jgi:hypothetical protein
MKSFNYYLRISNRIKQNFKIFLFFALLTSLSKQAKAIKKSIVSFLKSIKQLLGAQHQIKILRQDYT